MECSRCGETSLQRTIREESTVVQPQVRAVSLLLKWVWLMVEAQASVVIAAARRFSSLDSAAHRIGRDAQCRGPATEGMLPTVVVDRLGIVTQTWAQRVGEDGSFGREVGQLRSRRMWGGQ
jgi:hypothetical protein